MSNKQRERTKSSSFLGERGVPLVWERERAIEQHNGTSPAPSSLKVQQQEWITEEEGLMIGYRTPACSTLHIIHHHSHTILRQV